MVEIIAEISGNHGGDIKNAMLLIEAAKQAGADAVKLQCFNPERLVAKRANNPAILEWIDVRDQGLKLLGLPAGPTLLELYHQTVTPREWFPQLFKLAADLGIELFSSVFDPDDVAFLETLGCPRYKISSFELGDADLLHACCKTGKPLIMSASLKAPMILITLAINAALLYPNYRNWKVTLLHATAYDQHDIHPGDLWRFDELRRGFLQQHVAVGVSNHIPSIGAACAMARRGASMIEVHLKLPNVETPDSDFSYEPQALYHMIKNVRRIGNGPS